MMKLRSILTTKEVNLLPTVIILTAFLISSFFVCHSLLARNTASSDHHSERICYSEKRILKQNQLLVLSVNRSTRNSKPQKLILNSPQLTRSSFGLTKQRDGLFTFSGNLLNPQIPRLLTVVKLE